MEIIFISGCVEQDIIPSAEEPTSDVEYIKYCEDDIDCVMVNIGGCCTCEWIAVNKDLWKKEVEVNCENVTCIARACEIKGEVKCVDNECKII